jgi:hypothetical protein
VTVFGPSLLSGRVSGKDRRRRASSQCSASGEGPLTGPTAGDQPSREIINGSNADGAPYSMRGLLRNLGDRFSLESSQPNMIAAAFLDEAKCPGARGLSKEDKLKLRDMRDRHSQAPSGPAPLPPKQ